MDVVISAFATSGPKIVSNCFYLLYRDFRPIYVAVFGMALRSAHHGGALKVHFGAMWGVWLSENESHRACDLSEGRVVTKRSKFFKVRVNETLFVFFSAVNAGCGVSRGLC